KILEESDTKKASTFLTPTDVTELEPPIRLPSITDLIAEITFKPLGLFTVTLNWLTPTDSRIEYRIFEKSDKGEEFIGSVEGKGSFEIENINIFSIPSYYIVPFNNQTDEEGKKSNLVKPSLF